jgi:PAS domain S-box-containing protein
VRGLPELFDLRVKARSLAYLFAAGALLAGLTLVLPHPSEVDDSAVMVLGCAALLISLPLFVFADRVRDAHLHVAVAVGTVIISLANVAVGQSLLYPLLYSWAALYAFYFFPMGAALAHLAFIGVAYAAVLVYQDGPLVRWPLAVGTPAVAGLLMARLLGNLRRQAAAAEERTSELRQSESRTRLLLESAPDAFLAIDARSGAVTVWNTAAERLFGWTAGEAIGTPLRGLVFPEEGRAAFDERLESLRDQRSPVVIQIEVELQRRDGTVFPAEETIHRVAVGDDVVLSAFVRDLTERRRRQQEREALLSEQAARAEAERVAEMVSGMQLVVDAALAHRTTHDILPDLVSRVRGVLGADGASIYLAEDDRLSLRAASGSTNGRDEDALDFGEGFAGRVAAAREPLLSPDGQLADHGSPPANPEDDSLVGVPLVAGDGVTGVLVVFAAAPRRFTSDDLSLLRLAADRVALGIDRARVYEREHRIAETLQRSLLPDQLPRLPGLTVAARYLPAAAEAEVGGDWYDVIPMPGGRVGLVMGDVAGKGLAAASMVGRLRSALRAYALEGHDPATALEQLNRLLWTEAHENQMATLLYAIVDPADGSIRWVNAGHMPPMVVSEGEPPRFLGGPRSVPLGVLPFPGFEEVSSWVRPGSSVVLYTDGLVERPGVIIDEGMSMLARVVNGAGSDPEALCDHLLASLVPDGGAPDDVALLALRNEPMTDRFRIEFVSEPESLAAMRGLLRRWLRHAEAGEEEAAEIVTACGEAATNAIEHAGVTGNPPFELAGAVHGRRVDLTVRDRGRWRLPRRGDQGRGLSLMRALMDTVEVAPGPDGTRVRMQRELTGGGSPSA